ncbi:hypothetical protein B0T13DRAFT_463228 [Neurospora crassa]|nr:hypothetical protein B0T13DRAFT_463228 [Neurospora crassa]
MLLWSTQSGWTSVSFSLRHLCWQLVRGEHLVVLCWEDGNDADERYFAANNMIQCVGRRLQKAIHNIIMINC